MRLTCTVVLLAAALVNIAEGFTASNFTETGECQGADQVCFYDYTVQQQYFAKDGQNQNSSIVSEVEIMCNSVGEYNGESAVLYCMTVRDIELQGTFFNEEEEEIRNRHKYLLQSLSGRFCFAQTSDGKVPAIFYIEPQSDSTLNFKKAIAAAFQANFKGTDVEEELDPQSMHRSHYKITTSNEEGTVKMHRSVNEDDVIEYSTGAPKREVKLKKEEDIEYQSGKLQHSSGNTSVRISKDTDKKGDQESFSNLFSVRGSYSLDLKRCSSITKRAYSRHRRNVRDDIEKSGIEENLRAKYNKSVAEIEEMKILRGKLPSVLDALFEFQNDTSTIDVIEKLLELEYQHGPLPGYSSALSDVLEYFTSTQDSTDSSDEQMRVIVYSLLAAEGSFQSQMVLFHTLKMATMSEREKNVLINVIGMVKNPHWDFVGLLKEYLNSITKDAQSDGLEAEALLLSFGALASGANPDVQEFIVSFLFELQNGNQEFEIPLILALGNTGSKLVVDTLLSFLDSPNKDIQIITIQSLRKFTFNQLVLDRLEKVLTEQSDEDILAAVIEVLLTGLEYSSNFDMEHFDAHNELLSEHRILATLVMATLQTNNTELDALVQTLLKDVGGEQALTLLTHFHQLSKRGTDWDENNSAVYDLVASLSSRQSDVNTYQRHCAYIWGKTFGIDEANLVVAAGLFGGISNDCNNVKVFGRAVAKGNVFKRSATVIDLQVDLRKTTTTIEGRVYANIAGNFLVDYSRSYPLRCTSPQCYNYERELFNERYLIFSFTYPVFVYVTTINFVLQLHGTLSVGFNAEICGQTAQTDLLSGNAGFTGSVGASLSGEINTDLLEVARAGITASATFIYQLEPSVSAQACRSECSVQHRACCGVYDQWPGNTLEIKTWYQIRGTEWCGDWVKYPCGTTWGDRQTWYDFSWSWSLGSRERRPLYEQCFGTSNPQCSAVTTTTAITPGAADSVGQDPHELVECFVDQNCQEDATPLLVTRRECCVGNPAGAGFRIEGDEACNVCVVFGFFQTTFTAPEQGQGYSIPVGYLKRPRTGVVALPFTVLREFLGTTTIVDFTLQTAFVAVLPSQDSRDVTFTFQVDGIAQELDETVRLKLSVSQTILYRLPGELNNSVYFLDTADLVIVDSDSLEIQFTEEDYRNGEATMMLPVRVNKNQRIATPVTVRVTPSTLTKHRLTGRDDPPGTLEDNPDSPIEANEDDFINTAIEVTFQPDEIGQQMDDVDTPIGIIDDVINEATEQNFVVTLEIVSAFDTSKICISRKDSLGRIIDDDYISIGFQQPYYNFDEPPDAGDSEDIVDIVLLEKENGVVSEQTLFILVTVTPTTPNQAIRPAELSMDGADNDYAIGPNNYQIILIMEPEEQITAFNFRLFGDDIAEGTEAFQATSTRVEDTPEYLPPIALSPSTFILIEDNDMVTIGFERNYTVAEFIGMQEICAVVTFPPPTVPILDDIILSANTIQGTADEMDYGRIAESDGTVFVLFNNIDRRQCFPLEIINDDELEDTESLTIELVFSSFFTVPSSVILDPNVTTVTIIRPL